MSSPWTEVILALTWSWGSGLDCWCAKTKQKNHFWNKVRLKQKHERIMSLTLRLQTKHSAPPMMNNAGDQCEESECWAWRTVSAPVAKGNHRRTLSTSYINWFFLQLKFTTSVQTPAEILSYSCSFSKIQTCFLLAGEESLLGSLKLSQGAPVTVAMVTVIHWPLRLVVMGSEWSAPAAEVPSVSSTPAVSVDYRPVSHRKTAQIFQYQREATMKDTPMTCSRTTECSTTFSTLIQHLTVWGALF